MSAFRRPRIKASVTHLASLAGKRRVVVNHGNEESQTNNNEIIKKETPLVNNINVPNVEKNGEFFFSFGGFKFGNKKQKRSLSVSFGAFEKIKG